MSGVTGSNDKEEETAGLLSRRRNSTSGSGSIESDRSSRESLLEEGRPEDASSRRVKPPSSPPPHSQTSPTAASSSLSSGNSLSLRIKTTGNGNEYVVKTESGATVAQLKRKVARVLGAPEGRFVRLIAAGKMLSPDDAVLQRFKLADNSVVHCVISATAPQSTSLLPSVMADNAAEEESDSDEEAAAARRGFSRLRNEGMTRAEVTAIQAYFSNSVRAYMTGPTFREIEGEEGMQRLWRGEEEWMALQDADSEFVINTTNLGPGERLMGQARAQAERVSAGGILFGDDNGGTTRDFIIGFLMGFVLGFVMLFWIWEGTIPHKQKMGVLAGVMCKMSLRFAQTPTSEKSEEGE